MNDDCATLLQKIDRHAECIRARARINGRCFRGGDPGHNEIIMNGVRGAILCWGYYSRKCTPPPLPVPEPRRERDRGLMRRMQEITGLTGAALVAYIILSEGSRLFPPRNLVPVP